MGSYLHPTEDSITTTKTLFTNYMDFIIIGSCMGFLEVAKDFLHSLGPKCQPIFHSPKCPTSYNPIL